MNKKEKSLLIIKEIKDRIKNGVHVITPNGLDITVRGITYVDPCTIQKITDGLPEFRIVAEVYRSIYARCIARSARGGDFDFTARLDIDSLPMTITYGKDKMRRMLDTCLEKGWLIHEEGDEYSLNPMFCPYRDLYTVLAWHERRLYKMGHLGQMRLQGE